MKILSLMLLAAVTLLSGCAASNPSKDAVSNDAMSNPVVVSQSVPYSPDSGATLAVKRECIIDSQLPEFIESYASSYDIAVIRDGQKAASSKGRVLELKFSQVYGFGGGAWSGAKSVTVKGTLKDNGKTIGTFIGTRFSGGGLFGGFKGTCSILGRCVKALGNDIARWLQAPSMDARLGDAG
jgi:hypothetical protein